MTTAMVTIPKRMLDNFNINKTNIEVFLAIRDHNCQTYDDMVYQSQKSYSAVKNSVERLIEFDFLIRKKNNHGNGYTYTIPEHYKFPTKIETTTL